MESDKIEEKIKQKLKEQYDHLNPAELKRKIDRLQSKFYRLYLKEQREKAKDELPNTIVVIIMKIIISYKF